MLKDSADAVVWITKFDSREYFWIILRIGGKPLAILQIKNGRSSISRYLLEQRIS